MIPQSIIRHAACAAAENRVPAVLNRHEGLFAVLRLLYRKFSNMKTLSVQTLASTAGRRAQPASPLAATERIALKLSAEMLYTVVSSLMRA